MQIVKNCQIHLSLSKLLETFQFEKVLMPNVYKWFCILFRFIRRLRRPAAQSSGERKPADERRRATAIDGGHSTHVLGDKSTVWAWWRRPAPPHKRFYAISRTSWNRDPHRVKFFWKFGLKMLGASQKEWHAVRVNHLMSELRWQRQAATTPPPPTCPGKWGRGVLEWPTGGVTTGGVSCWTSDEPWSTAS